MKRVIDVGVIVTIIVALASIVYGYGFLNAQVQDNKARSEYNKACIDNMYEKLNRIDRQVGEMHGYMKAKGDWK